VVSLWQVTSQGERGEIRTHVVAVAVGHDGQRVPAWERTVDQLFHAPAASRSTQPPVELLTETCESMLHRELGHRQIISEQRGYETRMIGWIEVVGHVQTWSEQALKADVGFEWPKNILPGPLVTES
jgi:hypothetical protein